MFHNSPWTLEAFNDLLRCSASNIGVAWVLWGGGGGTCEQERLVAGFVEEMNKSPAARETPATIEAYKGLLGQKVYQEKHRLTVRHDKSTQCLVCLKYWEVESPMKWDFLSSKHFSMGYLVPLYVAEVSWIYMETSMNWQLIYRGDDVPLNEMNRAIDVKTRFGPTFTRDFCWVYIRNLITNVCYSKVGFNPLNPMIWMIWMFKRLPWTYHCVCVCRLKDLCVFLWEVGWDWMNMLRGLNIYMQHHGKVFDHGSCRRFFILKLSVWVSVFTVNGRSQDSFPSRFRGFRFEKTMLHLDVALPSGHTERLCISKSSNVGHLKFLALQTLGRHQSDQGGGLKLITAEGISLDSKISLEDTKLQDGDHLLAVAVPRKCLAATGNAFAIWYYGGNGIVTWGHEWYGSDSSEVQKQLKGVQEVVATRSAFAALLADGSVVTWGDVAAGGDSSRVQDQLKMVQSIQATDSAFAARLADGSVVTWGISARGGDSSGVQDQLKNVQEISATNSAFAAILGDASVITWGHQAFGGDSSYVQHLLKNVEKIQGTCDAFAAILKDGSVVTWGVPISGGDSSDFKTRLQNVQKVKGSDNVFAAILADGSVVEWGEVYSDTDISQVEDQLKNVQELYATDHAFAALLADKSVITWGRHDEGGDSSGVQLSDVQQISATNRAFAAILTDGSVVTWGDPNYGGNSWDVQDQLRNVQYIHAASAAFCAILLDESIVTWGQQPHGGDSSGVEDQLASL